MESWPLYVHECTYVFVTGVVKMEIKISHDEKTISQPRKLCQHDINVDNELIIGETIPLVGRRSVRDKHPQGHAGWP